MKTKYFFEKYILSFVLLLALPADSIARAGGGGGGGGHGGGGGGGGHGYYGAGHGSARLTDEEARWLVIILISIVVLTLAYSAFISYLYFSKGKKNEKKLRQRKETDLIWDYDKIIAYSEQFYRELQDCWTKRNLLPLKSRIAPPLYNQYSRILSNYKKRGIVNKVEDIRISEIFVIYFDDYIDNSKDAVALLIKGTLKDYFITEGYSGNAEPEEFKDALVFTRKNDTWILDEIMNEPVKYQVVKPKTYIEQ